MGLVKVYPPINSQPYRGVCIDPQSRIYWTWVSEAYHIHENSANFPLRGHAPKAAHSAARTQIITRRSQRG